MAKKARRAIAIGATAMSTTQSLESIQVGDGFSANVNGLTVIGTPTFAAWEDVGKRLRILERASQFALGDYLNRVEDQWGEEASQIIDATEWSEKTCATYRWLAQSIVQETRRMDRLGVAHHLLVAALSPAKQKEWLDKAADDDNPVPWTVSHMRKAMDAGGDLTQTAWWVVVACKSAKDQQAFMKEMEKAGRVCKAQVKRERRKTKAKVRT